MNLSNNSLERICKIFGYLEALGKQEIGFVSSSELAKAIGATEYTVRKDISLLGLTGHTRRGYAVATLKQEIGNKLNLAKKRKACIVGLGRLGSALLDYQKFSEDGFEIVAGFDSSINKIERIKTSVDVFGDNQLENVVKARNIELGIIAVPANSAQAVSDRLIQAGVKGILNFSPIKIKVPKNIVHLDLDFTNALRFVAASMKGGNNG